MKRQELELGGDSRRPDGEVVVAVLLSYNSLPTLRRTVTSVLEQARPPDHFVIVDNGSGDGSREWLRDFRSSHPNIELLEYGENLGVGAGHASGWRRALELCPECTALWVLEHDCLPPADTLQRLIQHMPVARSPISVIVPKEEFTNRSTETTWKLRKRLRIWIRRANPILRRLRLSSGVRRPEEKFTFNGILIPTDIVRAVGLPREDFFVGLEDREYSHRVLAAGYEIKRDESIRVWHVHDNHGGLASPQRWYYSSRNSIYLDAKIRGSPLAVVRGFVRFLAAVLFIGIGAKNRRSYILARFLGFRDGLLGRLGEVEHDFTQDPP